MPLGTAFVGAEIDRPARFVSMARNCSGEEHPVPTTGNMSEASSALTGETEFCPGDKQEIRNYSTPLFAPRTKSSYKGAIHNTYVYIVL